jgi:hypothetical protein
VVACRSVKVLLALAVMESEVKVKAARQKLAAV